MIINGFIMSNLGFDMVINCVMGMILGGIVGLVGILINVGLIDGGSGNVLIMGNVGMSYLYQIGFGVWINSGMICLNSGVVMIVSFMIGILSNSGMIVNMGVGVVLLLLLFVIQNLVGGQICSGGVIVINGIGYVNIVNWGMIIGNIVIGNIVSVIDFLQGWINGLVVFGVSNDMLIVCYDGIVVLVMGIIGIIIVGGGINI